MRILLVSIIFFLLALGVNYQVIQNGQAYQTGKESYAENMNYRNRLFDPDEWLGSESLDQKLAIGQRELDKLNQLRTRGNSYLFAQFLLIIGYLSIIFIFFRKENRYTILVIGLITSALACLPAGLFSPMLEIGASEHNLNFGEIPISAKILGMNVQVEVSQRFQGDVYFFYQSKSVIELIQLLFQQNNWVVGISILLFSILFPFAKIIATYLTVLHPKALQHKALGFFIEKSGKWSMADVFVVAVFLAFLAFSNMQVGIRTESKVLVGLYFFLGYCLLSLGASSFLAAAKRERVEVQEIST